MSNTELEKRFLFDIELGLIKGHETKYGKIIVFKEEDYPFDNKNFAKMKEMKNFLNQIGYRFL